MKFFTSLFQTVGLIFLLWFCWVEFASSETEKSETTGNTELQSRFYSMLQASDKITYEGHVVLDNGYQWQAMRIGHRLGANGLDVQIEPLTGLLAPSTQANETKTPRGDDLSEMNKSRWSIGLPQQKRKSLIGVIDRYYEFQDGGMDRVAGRLCRKLILKPIDQFRYNNAFCIDDEIHLPLSATLEEDGELRERWMFVDLRLVQDQEAEAENPVRQDSREASNDDLASDGYRNGVSPPGYVLLHHHMTPDAHGFEQWVYSDGVAIISAFVQTASDIPADVGMHSPVLRRYGALNIYSRTIAGGWLTLIGQAPMKALEYIAARWPEE